MKKVCILQNGLARGGTDTFVVNLCVNLDKSRFDVYVVNPSSKPSSQVREQELLDSGVKILRTCDCNSALNKIRHLYRLYKHLKENRFDVFQTNIDLFNGPNLLVAWLARIPIRCCHSHNTRQQKEIIEGRTLSIRMYQSLMRWMCWTFSNRRSGCSSDAMDFLFENKKWREEPYPTIISNGIDINKFRANINREERRKSLGLNAKYNIITVGHLIPQKNPLFTVAVFNELCKKRTDCDLIIVGDGCLREECIERLNQCGIIDRAHFLGVRNDVQDILSCSDVFFLPSIFEGLGIVAIEAQASGLPCVLSNGFPSEVDCGGCKFISLDESPSYWANVISDIIDNRNMNNIDEYKIQKFSVYEMVSQMSKVFEYN